MIKTGIVALCGKYQLIIRATATIGRSNSFRVVKKSSLRIFETETEATYLPTCRGLMWQWSVMWLLRKSRLGVFNGAEAARIKTAQECVGQFGYWRSDETFRQVVFRFTCSSELSRPPRDVSRSPLGVDVVVELAAKTHE